MENSMKVLEIREQSECMPQVVPTRGTMISEKKCPCGVPRQREPRQPPRVFPWLSFLFCEGRRLTL